MNGLHLLVAFVIIGSLLKYYLDKKYKPIYKKLQLFGYNIIIIKWGKNVSSRKRIFISTVIRTYG